MSQSGSSIHSPTPCYDYAGFTPQPELQGHDRNVSVANASPYRRSPFLWVISQTLVEQLSDLVRPDRQVSRLRESSHLNGRLAVWIFQPHIDEIQAEHTHEHIEQGTNNLGWVTAAPHGGKGKETDQIVHAASKVLDLLSGAF